MRRFFILPKLIRKVVVLLAPLYALLYGIVGVYGGVTLISLSLKYGLNNLVTEVNHKTGDPLSFYKLLIGLTIGIALFFSAKKLHRKELQGWTILFTAEVIKHIVVIGSGVDPIKILILFITIYLLLAVKTEYKKVP